MLKKILRYCDVQSNGEAWVLKQLSDYGFDLTKKYYVEYSVFDMEYKFYQAVEDSNILWRKY